MKYKNKLTTNGELTTPLKYNPMDLKTALKKLFDKDLNLDSNQTDKLITIIGDHSKYEFNAGFQAAKKPI